MLQSSGTISVGDIRTEAGVIGTKSLADLLPLFPALDQSQPIPISRFYGASLGYTTFLFYGAETTTCTGSGSQTTYYQNNSTGVFYTDAAMTTVFNGGDFWYFGSGNYQINNSGVVIDTFAC